MKSSIELVVFDIAGTTVEDNGEIALAFQSAMRLFGYTVPLEKINLLMGYKKEEAIKTMLSEYEEDKAWITNERINAIHDLFMDNMIEYYATTKNIRPLPNAEKLFSILKEKGIKIGLDTGFSKEITDVVLARLGWLDNNLIDHVVSSNEVTAGRPQPYMIKQIMHQTGVANPANVIKVGDTEVDVQEGRNAGCRYTIGITTGAFTRDELMPYHPSFIIDDLMELLPIIDNN